MNDHQVPPLQSRPQWPSGENGYSITVFEDMNPNSPAVIEYRSCVEQFAVDLQEQIKLLEKSRRDFDLKKAEYTATIVKDANRQLRRSYERVKPVTKKEIAWLAVTVVDAFLLGLGTNYITHWYGTVLVCIALIGGFLAGFKSLLERKAT